MEEIQLINRIQNAIDSLFVAKFYGENDKMDIETLMFMLNDDLEILEEWMEEEKITIREIRKLVRKMVTAKRKMLPKIMFKIDEKMKKLLANACFHVDDLNKINVIVNKVDVNKIDVNKVDVNKIGQLISKPTV